MPNWLDSVEVFPMHALRTFMTVLTVLLLAMSAQAQQGGGSAEEPEPGDAPNPSSGNQTAPGNETESSQENAPEKPANSGPIIFADLPYIYIDTSKIPDEGPLCNVHSNFCYDCTLGSTNNPQNDILRGQVAIAYPTGPIGGYSHLQICTNL